MATQKSTVYRATLFTKGYTDVEIPSLGTILSL